MTAFGSPTKWCMSVFSTQYPVLGVLLIAGCTVPPEAKDGAQEPIPAYQVALVQSGKSDEISIASTLLTDADWKAIAACPSLRTLLLDNPEQQVSATDIKQLSSLENLEHLRIRGGGIDDAALVEVANLAGLQILNIPHSTMTDAGLIELKRLPELVQLRFGSPNVTDAGMRTIAELPALKRLHLIDVPITDGGLRELGKIEQLESLYIDGGKLSDAVAGRIVSARRGCTSISISSITIAIRRSTNIRRVGQARRRRATAHRLIVTKMVDPRDLRSLVPPYVACPTYDVMPRGSARATSCWCGEAVWMANLDASPESYDRAFPKSRRATCARGEDRGRRAPFVPDDSRPREELSLIHRWRHDSSAGPATPAFRGEDRRR